MPAALGKLEAQLFAYAQLRQQSAFRSQEVAQELGLSSSQTRDLLSRLRRRGVIARVRRGLYLVPTRLPPGGRWSPSEYAALATLMADCQGRCQICGPAAFQRYGWLEQIPNRLDAYNDRLSGPRRIGAVSLTLIKVSEKRLGDTEAFITPEGVEAIYSSRTRSLVDAVYDWSRFGSLPNAYEWIRRELRQGQITPEKLTQSALKFGNTSTLRRLGKLLELEQANSSLLKKLQRRLPETTALIAWCPTRPRRGRIDRTWGVVFNE